MSIEIQAVPCLVRKDIPGEEENIVDDLDINVQELKKACDCIVILQISPQECPGGIGNWTIDFMKDDDIIFRIKLPLNMSKKQVEKYYKPLLDIYRYSLIETHEGVGTLQ